MNEMYLELVEKKNKYETNFNYYKKLLIDIQQKGENFDGKLDKGMQQSISQWWLWQSIRPCSGHSQNSRQFGNNGTCGRWLHCFERLTASNGHLGIHQVWQREVCLFLWQEWKISRNHQCHPPTWHWQKLQVETQHQLCYASRMHCKLAWWYEFQEDGTCGWSCWWWSSKADPKMGTGCQVPRGVQEKVQFGAEWQGRCHSTGCGAFQEGAGFQRCDWWAGWSLCISDLFGGVFNGGLVRDWQGD